MISDTKQIISGLLISIFMLLCVPGAGAQTDSLYDALNSASSDSMRIECYKELSLYYLNHKKFDSTLICADKGIEIAKKAGMLPDIEFYQVKIRSYDALMKYREAMKQYPNIIKILEKSSNPDDAVRLILNKGWHLFRTGEFTKSIESFEKARCSGESVR